jgi:dihydroorotate dehydrogenase electron transfer subunit
MKIYSFESKVLKNQQIAESHYRLRLGISQRFPVVQAGQFLQIRVADRFDPFLPRPLCVYDYGKGWLEVVFQVVGRGTQILQGTKPGAIVHCTGPLGQGFPIAKRPDTVIFIAGGVGIASLYLAAKQWIEQIHLYEAYRAILLYGSQKKSTLCCHRDFKKLGFEIRIATDDGSHGLKGYVSDLLVPLFEKEDLGRSWVYACGPRPMFHALTQILPLYGQDAYFSMDENMACGLGVCLGCAVRVTTGSDEKYQLICREGPVFQMSQIQWREVSHG